MRIPLRIWFDEWTKEYGSSTYSLRDGASAQVMLVRDQLAPLVWADVPYEDRDREGEPRGDCAITVHVVGEHHSKSVRLPVYSFERPDLGIQMVLRGNFYDWKLSVVSEQPIESDLFRYLFRTTPPATGHDDDLSPSCFEGFPRDRIFGHHCEDPRRWSACLSERALWTTVLLCMRCVGAISPIP